MTSDRLLLLLVAAVAVTSLIIGLRHVGESSAVVNGWLRGPRCVIELRGIISPSQLGVSVHDDIGTTDQPGGR